VVEVLSTSTRAKDLVLKRALYEDSGVSSYWVVDPEEPSLLVLELQVGGYVEHARVRGDETATLSRPFEVTLAPSSLTA
jgi:Uma2 family endonuclease